MATIRPLASHVALITFQSAPCSLRASSMVQLNPPCLWVQGRHGLRLFLYWHPGGGINFPRLSEKLNECLSLNKD